jgi:hypothetical protein
MFDGRAGVARRKRGFSLFDGKTAEQLLSDPESAVVLAGIATHGIT